MIKPRGRIVLAKMVDSQKVTKSGLLLTGTAADSLAPRIADVIAVGKEVEGIKAGDQVVFKPYATYEIKVDDVQYAMLEEDDILGTVTPDPTDKTAQAKA